MRIAPCFWPQMKIASVLCAVFTIANFAGCATVGPKYSTTKNDIVTLSTNRGRIVFYRPDAFYGGGMRPDILLDGKKVGISRPGTVFFVDVDPGKHRVAIPAVLYPGETTIDLTVSQAETVYVKNYMGGSAFGGRTNVEVVPSGQAVIDVDGLVFMREPTI